MVLIDRVAGGDVAGDALVEPESAKDSQRCRELRLPFDEFFGRAAFLGLRERGHHLVFICGIAGAHRCSCLCPVDPAGTGSERRLWRADCPLRRIGRT